MAFFVMMAGVVGFFLPAATAMGGIPLPSSFEWPAWRVDGVVTLTGGSHAVPIEHAGRVQLYDQSWSFIRGFQVPAEGGTFLLEPGEGDTLVVSTARGNRRLVYHANGALASTADARGTRPQPAGHAARRVTVSLRPYLFVLYGPGITWITAVAGALMWLGTATFLSMAAETTLARLGILPPQSSVSPPTFGAAGFSVIALVMFALVATSAPPWFIAFWLAILVANVPRLSRDFWGFEITGTHVRVWLPLRPALNTVLTPEELIAGVAKMSLNSHLRLPGKKANTLSAIGTTRFRMLVDHVVRLKAEAERRQFPTS